MKKLCIFDLDGTLVNTLFSIASFANEALLACGYRGIPKERYRYLVGNGADVLMRGMLRTVEGAYTEEDVRQLRKVYDRLYEKDPLRGIGNYPGMEVTLKKLHSWGVLLAVLSNKPHSVVEAIIREVYPRGIFARCYGQMEEMPRKPAPDGALRIARELNCAPEECLYIGDTDVDMKTGAAAHMETVGVLWGFRDRKELEENHAVHLAERPEDLLEIVQGNHQKCGTAKF